MQDRTKDRPDSRDSQISDTDRAALDHAREVLTAHQHRVWLWGIIKGGAKWTAVVAGGLLVTLNVVKAVLSAIRDGM